MDKLDKSYHKNLVWQRLRDLLVITYKLTEFLPNSEQFGLISQMRRAAVSCLSNFVEGYLKKSTKEKLHFLEITDTSLLELEAQSEICFILNYWDKKQYEQFKLKPSEPTYFLHHHKS